MVQPLSKKYPKYKNIPTTMQLRVFLALYMKSCEVVIIASFSEQATMMTRPSKTSGSTYGYCCLLISNVLLINSLSKKTI